MKKSSILALIALGFTTIAFGMENQPDREIYLNKTTNTQATTLFNITALAVTAKTVHELYRHLCDSFHNTDTQTQYFLERQQTVKTLSDAIKTQNQHIATDCEEDDLLSPNIDNRAHAFATEVLLKAEKPVCKHSRPFSMHLEDMPLELFYNIVERLIHSSQSLEETVQLLTRLSKTNKALNIIVKDNIERLLTLKNFTQQEKDAALLQAVKNKNLSCMATLVKIGADVNVHSDDSSSNKTPLHLALEYEEGEFVHEDIVAFLLDRGARVDGVDSSLWTPLHYAAVSNNKNIVTLLLAYDADPEAMGEDKCSPLSLAKSCVRSLDATYQEIVDLLQEKIASKNG